MTHKQPIPNGTYSQLHQHEKQICVKPDPLKNYEAYSASLEYKNIQRSKTDTLTKSQLSAFFKDPLASPSSTWFRTQYERGFITNETLIKQFKLWSKTPFAINLINNATGEELKIHTVKRGTERFRINTWKRLYKACSEWVLCHPTIKYSTDKIIQYKKIRRRVHMNNLMIITLTYKQKLTSKHKALLWKNIMPDFNRWWTGLKQKIPIKYYIAATEAHESGNPHLHLIIKLRQPLETIKIGKYYRFRLKDAIESSWKQYGNVDIKAVSYNTHNPIGYIAKYIVKKIDENTPIKDITKHSLTEAHKWINRKHTFTHTRNKTLRAFTDAYISFNLLFNLDLPLKKGTNSYQVESYDYNGTIIQVQGPQWEPLTQKEWEDIDYKGYIKRRIEAAYMSYVARKRHFRQRILFWSARLFKKKEKEV